MILSSFIYPAIEKLFEENNDISVGDALKKLEKVFGKAENSFPGVTHKFIVHLVETLKKD